jgi:hypothetical protein
MTIKPSAPRRSNRLATLMLCASGLCSPALAAADRDRSLIPPSLSCPRDRLTSYTGRVVAYRRTPGHTWLRIATDWQTIEEVRLRHSARGDPARHFLIEGRPFAPADWARIEQRAGRLHKDVRATAWVCEDGRAPIVDWLPAAER